MAAEKVHFTKEKETLLMPRMRWFAGLLIRLWSHIPALRKVGGLVWYRF
jgi:hypothetical protein